MSDEGKTEVEKTSHSFRTIGSVKNNRPGQTLKLYGIHSWAAGDFVQEPNGSINAGGFTRFVEYDSKAALIYAEEDQQASNPAAYLLAWSAIDRPLRVYVKCGPLSELYYNGWENAALANLNSSGGKSSAQDCGTSSNAEAYIDADFPRYSVGATFN